MRLVLRPLCVLLLALAIATIAASSGHGYTKPVTYNKGSVVFKDRYLQSPHSWIIVKAVDLIGRDGYSQEAAVAEKYLLPMLEGVTFNDVWGDADLAGGSILDYYIPGSPETDFGFGCAGVFGIFAYKDCTKAVLPGFPDFQSNGFYGYANAAEEAQYRYDYAKRIYLDYATSNFDGQWASDSRDQSAGWVVDTLNSQDDPMNGDWGTGRREHRCRGQLTHEIRRRPDTLQRPPRPAPEWHHRPGCVSGPERDGAVDDLPKFSERSTPWRTMARDGWTTASAVLTTSRPTTATTGTGTPSMPTGRPTPAAAATSIPATLPRWCLFAGGLPGACLLQPRLVAAPAQGPDDPRPYDQ